MSKRSSADQGLWLIIVGLAAWVIPGAGHFLLRERKRAIIIFITITALFLTGLYVGSIGIVNHETSKPWFMAQVLYSPAVGILSQKVTVGYLDADGNQQEYTSFGHPCDIGQLYTGVAGLLNLLCIFSAVYMAYCGRGEMIGAEEETEHA
ncbi:MAG: hypothetical protein ISS71_09915 [Phycisphaerae bacterium]|nr:hypothetical protein [Phycisphaerae bacterium]